MNQASPDRAPDVSIVVPVFNSSATLAELHRRLAAVMDGLGGTCELVLVDDASADESWAGLKRLAARDRRIAALRLAANIGQDKATVLGLALARGRIVVTLDDDLQHPPEEIPRLIALLGGAGGADAVLGMQHTRKQTPWRRLLSGLAHVAELGLLGKPRWMRFSGFRAMTASVAAGIVEMRAPLPSVAWLMAEVAPSVVPLHFPHGASAIGSSRYTLGKLIRSQVAVGRCAPRRRLAWLGAASIAIAAAALGSAGIAALALADAGASAGRILRLAASAIAGLAALAVAATALNALADRRRPRSALGFEFRIAALAGAAERAVARLPRAAATHSPSVRR